MAPTKHRTIVESARFKSERAAIAPSISRWDEVFRAVEWGLAQAPEVAGKATHVDGVFAIPTDDWPDVPAVVVYYRFDESTVTLLSLILADTADE